MIVCSPNTLYVTHPVPTGLLQFNQGSETAATPDQLVRCAPFDDPPVVKDDHPVSRARRGQAMRHRDRRPLPPIVATDRRLQGSAELGFTGIVHRRRGLVQQKHCRIPHQCPRQREQLLLPFGKLYPFVAPYLGLLAGFISGSETSAIAMLTAIHLSTAEKIGALGLLIAAASGIGGGLASVISPAKLQNAAAAIDMIGEESKVLRVTFVISLVLTSVAAVMTMLWAFG